MGKNEQRPHVRSRVDRRDTRQPYAGSAISVRGLVVMTENPFAALLLDESHDALVALSLEGRVLSWNRGAEAIFGYPSSEAIGASLDELVVPVDGRDAARAALKRAQDDGRTVFEAERRRKDGSPVTVDV